MVVSTSDSARLVDMRGCEGATKAEAPLARRAKKRAAFRVNIIVKVVCRVVFSENIARRDFVCATAAAIVCWESFSTSDEAAGLSREAPVS